MVPALARSSGRVQVMPHPEVATNGSPSVTVGGPNCLRLSHHRYTINRDFPLNYRQITRGSVNVLGFVFEFARHLVPLAVELGPDLAERLLPCQFAIQINRVKKVPRRFVCQAVAISGPNSGVRQIIVASEYHYLTLH